MSTIARLLCVACALLGVFDFARADERILEFHSKIDVAADASMRRQRLRSAIATARLAAC